jgi:hypothetical protein
MKKLLMLAVLFVSPAHADFDFGKMLEEVAEEAAGAVINPRSTRSTKSTASEKSPTMTREGYVLNGGDNSDRYNEIHRFLAKKTVKLSPDKDTIEAYIKEADKYCPEKFGTKRCHFAQEQVAVMKGHTIRNELVQAVRQLKRDRPTYSSAKSIANLAKAEDLIEQYKLGNHADDRTFDQIYDDLSNENHIIQAKLEKEQEIKQQQANKNAELAKVKWVNNNIDSVKAGPFNAPYKACIAEGDKAITMAKLVDSQKMTKDYAAQARNEFKKQCSCVYVNIHTNSEGAPARDRKNMANDLVKIESSKVKDSEVKLTKWEIKEFRSSLNNADASGVALMNASLECY